MNSAGLKLAVGTQRRFAPGYRRAWQLREKLGKIFLGRAHYLFNWGPQLSWRGDKASSGGGALLELSYHFIDLMVWMLGLPEEVYGLSAGGNRPEVTAADGKPLPLYDTDDTAAAIMRYGKDSMAVVTSTRASGPVSEALNLHGHGGSIRASSEQCLLRDPDGTSVDQLADDSPQVNVFIRQAEAFASAVANNTATYECSAYENLLNMAVVEAIYLSDRTGQPESPLRLLRTQDLTVDQCLALQPKSEGQPTPT
jgi:predicted dehydrogenase